jgi:hypothetical protein
MQLSPFGERMARRVEAALVSAMALAWWFPVTFDLGGGERLVHLGDSLRREIDLGGGQWSVLGSASVFEAPRLRALLATVPAMPAEAWDDLVGAGIVDDPGWYEEVARGQEA